MVKVTGAREHSANLRRIAGEEMVTQVGAALFVGGQRIQVDAQISIVTGAVSGKGHVPSKPGDPPSADTHFLANNIETAQVGPLKVQVSSNAPYSRALEDGTSKMQARPFMWPALRRNEAGLRELLQTAVAKVARGGKVT